MASQLSSQVFEVWWAGLECILILNPRSDCKLLNLSALNPADSILSKHCCLPFLQMSVLRGILEAFSMLYDCCRSALLEV